MAKMNTRPIRKFETLHMDDYIDRIIENFPIDEEDMIIQFESFSFGTIRDTSLEILDNEGFEKSRIFQQQLHRKNG